MRSLTKSSLRYLLKHPWQFGLSVLGIGMGVAIVVSIDIANHSSATAFGLSMEAVSGKATHQILGPAGGIPDSFYVQLRTSYGLREIAPIIETYVRIDDEGRKIFRLLGVDFFAERPFRNYLATTGASIDGSLKEFLTEPGAIVLSQKSLAGLGKSLGESVTVTIGGTRHVLSIAGVISEPSQNSSALENLLITDIASAQEITGRIGRIDFIDVILTEESERARLEGLLPAGYTLQRSGSRTSTAEQMLEAFEINLLSLSLLALIVGVFLIYNTMTFSVVQRRPLIGVLRSIGASARQISRQILLEALVVGAIGTALGFILAYFISSHLIRILSQTINDLYFVLSVREISITPLIIAKGIALGICASVLSALKPAREASSVHPRSAMIRSEQETSLQSQIPRMSIVGLACLIAGAAILLVPSRSIWLGYLGILPVIAGFALLTPVVIVLIERVSTPVYARLFGTSGKIASRSLVQNISRTYVAVAALALAVASTVGVGTMISSFRSTVVTWLESRLNADVFVSVPSFVSRRNDAEVPEEALAAIQALDGVEATDHYRELDVNQDGETYLLLAAALGERGASGFRFKEGDPARVWPRFAQGELIASEPFAYRHNLEIGSVLRLKTDRGMRDFTVAAITYDYATDQGLAFIDYGHFRKHWDAKGLSGISVFARDKSQIDAVKQRIQSLDADGQELLVTTYSDLRENSIAIFDRTFVIAWVLQILAVIVAFVGILSSLMSLQLERNRELAILRANGFVPGQIFGMVTLQTLLMGATAGLLALPLGNVLALILVHIINKRSFGWTMQFDLIPSIMMEAALLALIAALLAGLYPGYKMSQASPAIALREE